jgi:two-component system, NtrC family, sensor histidine kinase GlrK
VKITTRIAVGLTLLTALTVGVLAYQLRTVNHLQAVNDELSRTNLEAARVSIRLVQDLEGVREFASKALVLEDPGYVEQWAAWEEAVVEDLTRIRSLELGPRERQALRDVEAGWRRYLIELAPLKEEGADRPAGEELLATLDHIDLALDELRLNVEEVIEANQAEVARQARESAEAGDRARTVSWMAAGAAGVLGFLICVVLFLSISGPLKRLTRGTREVAEGRFQYRLPAQGRDELSELARDFNRMAAQLDELEDMKRDFVSHVSHELKGPLAAIHETILVLLEEIPGPLNEKQAQLLALSRQSATRLSGMIANLLQISRIESGAMFLEPTWVDLEALIEDVRDELQPLAGQRPLELYLDEAKEGGPIRMAGDADRIREVASNLLGNAIKFSPPDEPIELKVWESPILPDGIPERHRPTVARQRPPFVILTVEDRGPGIPPEHWEGIFEKFHQVKKGVRLQGQGVGLGLSICRNVVEAHGGAIWVEEGGEGGARFIVVLPRVANELQDAVKDQDGAPSDGSSPTHHAPSDRTRSDAPVGAGSGPTPLGGPLQTRDG